MELQQSNQSLRRKLTDKELIDTIIYLTSLASETKAIDSDLDTLRTITAQSDIQVGLSAEDRRALQRVISKIKDYLVHRDPLRDFTEASLEQRLNATAQSSLPRRKSLGYSAAVLIAAICSLPVIVIPSSFSFWDRLFIAAPIFILATALLNCWFYLSSLQNFKPQLRRVFIYFCVGSIVLGVQFVHFISIRLLHQEQDSLYKYGGLTIFASIALLAIYIGLRKYARILGIQSHFTSAGLIVGVQAVAAAAAFAVPFLLAVPEKGYFGFSVFSLFTLMVSAAFGVGTSYAIMRNVTAAYAASMKWLFLFTISAYLGPLVYVTTIMVRGELSGSALGAALAVCALPPMLLLMYSGYSFKKETGR
jgi:hypothetical protein